MAIRESTVTFKTRVVISMKVTLRLFRLTTVAVEKQNVLYNLSVSVALFAQHAKCICGLSGSTHSFPHGLINGTISGGGGMY